MSQSTSQRSAQGAAAVLAPHFNPPLPHALRSKEDFFNLKADTREAISMIRYSVGRGELPPEFLFWWIRHTAMCQAEEAAGQDPTASSLLDAIASVSDRAEAKGDEPALPTDPELAYESKELERQLTRRLDQMVFNRMIEFGEPGAAVFWARDPELAEKAFEQGDLFAREGTLTENKDGHRFSGGIPIPTEADIEVGPVITDASIFNMIGLCWESRLTDKVAETMVGQVLHRMLRLNCDGLPMFSHNAQEETTDDVLLIDVFLADQARCLSFNLEGCGYQGLVRVPVRSQDVKSDLFDAVSKWVAESYCVLPNAINVYAKVSMRNGEASIKWSRSSV